MSLADQTGLPTIYSLLNSRAYSTEFDMAKSTDKTNLSLSDVKTAVATSETEPRRANSFTDFLFRRRNNRNNAVVNVIENPMHSMLDDTDASEDAA